MSGNKESLSFTGMAIPFRITGRYLELMKLHLCLYIGISGIFGHVAATGVFGIHALVTGSFICVLASGAAVLNNIQDREYDRFFVRTRHRSLPTGRVPLDHARVLAILLVCSGLWGLWGFTGFLPFLLGVAALVVYNLLYTPLKKKNFLAMVPGSFCGMIVPAIGWTAADRSLADPSIFVIMAVFGLWQMAHSFIILLKTRHRMVSHPEASKFANFFACFSVGEIKLQIMIWTSLFTLSMLWFVIQYTPGNMVFNPVLILNAVAAWALVFRVIFQRKPAPSLAFAFMNLSILVFMGTGIFSALVF